MVTPTDATPKNFGQPGHLPTVNHPKLFWRPWGLDLTHRCGRFAGATTPFLRSGSPFWTSLITLCTRALWNASKSNGYTETRPRAGSPK
jgi:hypothetical protein